MLDLPRLFPAHAGMIPNGRTRTDRPDPLPRTRGDDPLYAELTPEDINSSPHTRG